MILKSASYFVLPPQRIISLVPSITELLFTLGLEKEVIGITKFCVHPQAWFKNKTRIGGTKNVNLQQVIDLKPDLILANKEENTRTDVEFLAAHCNVWVTDIHTLEDATKMISNIGELTGKQLLAENFISDIQVGFDKILPLHPQRRAAYFIWKDPYMVAAGNTFIDSMLHYCGLQNCFENLQRYPEIIPGTLNKENCDVLLLSSEPYPFNEKHAQQVTHDFPEIPILLVDGEMFSWYGSRLLHSAHYFQTLNTSFSR